MSYNRETKEFVDKVFGGKLPTVTPCNPDGSTQFYVHTMPLRAYHPFRETAPLDIKLWVRDQPTPAGKNRHPSGHRIMATCPFCTKTVSFGRLHQHAVIHF